MARVEFRGPRRDLIAFAKEHGINVKSVIAKPYSSDRNLLHISFEAGVLEDPWSEPDESMFVLSVSPEKAPDKPEYIEIEFEQGNAVALKTEADASAKPLTPGQMMKALNKLGGKHGVGRVDMVENRFVGMKSRGRLRDPRRHDPGVRAPADRVPHDGPRDDAPARRLIPRYAEMVYYGFWYAPEREALQALISESQKTVRGTVRLKLYKGNIVPAGRKSPLSLYQTAVASMEADGGAYNQADAGGFIRLNGLRLRARAAVQGAPVVQRASKMREG